MFSWITACCEKESASRYLGYISAPLITAQAQERFHTRLKGVTEPDQKMFISDPAFSIEDFV